MQVENANNYHWKSSFSSSSYSSASLIIGVLFPNGCLFWKCLLGGLLSGVIDFDTGDLTMILGVIEVAKYIQDYINNKELV
jgi:hypothetical protein